MSEIAVPHIELPTGPFDHTGMMRRVRQALMEGVLGNTSRPWLKAADDLIRWVGFGDAVEAKILDHIFNDGTYSAPTPNLALGTGAISDSDVAASFGGTTEANYTGYARVQIAAADMSAASAGSKTNSNAITFPACTGSSAVVIAWCVTSSGATTARLSAGDVIVYGTCTSTTVDTTHTPPTVAASGLVCNLD
jgi:hypothetical protein